MNRVMHRIFVYGTLKRGQPNYKLLESVDNVVKNFIGIGKTLDKYPLVIASRYNIPFVLGSKDAKGAKVRPEMKTTLNFFTILKRSFWSQRAVNIVCIRSMLRIHPPPPPPPLKYNFKRLIAILSAYYRRGSRNLRQRGSNLRENFDKQKTRGRAL